MKDIKGPTTQATLFLKENGVAFTDHLYVYEVHGDRKVSTKELARQIGCKKVEPCKPEVANKHSGYLVGGTSPFGTKSRMPVYVERSILELNRIYINGGRRGYLVGIDPKELSRLLAVEAVEVAAV